MDHEQRAKEAIIVNQQQDTNVRCEKESSEPIRELLHPEIETPLFLRDTSEGQKGDAQDEKDEMEE